MELSNDAMSALKASGLKTTKLERAVQSGRQVQQVVFSASPSLIDTYVECFAKRPVDRSAETRRLEGWLFGYPSCCVEHFFVNGYGPNRLPPEMQGLLFHWACPDCEVTPGLLPAYGEVYRVCEVLFATDGTAPSRGVGWHVKTSFVATASCLLLLTSVSCRKSLNSPERHDYDPRHLISLPTVLDPDQDYLANVEEEIFGTDPRDPDTDGNLVLDGVHLAKELYEAIRVLPREVQTSSPYVVKHMARGIETCEVCGETVTMGYIEIINPGCQYSPVSIPYIGLHFLEPGALS